MEFRTQTKDLLGKEPGVQEKARQRQTTEQIMQCKAAREGGDLRSAGVVLDPGVRGSGRKELGWANGPRRVEEGLDVT